jgi:hypothetical protein
MRVLPIRETPVPIMISREQILRSTPEKKCMRYWCLLRHADSKMQGYNVDHTLPVIDVYQQFIDLVLDYQV